MTALPEYVFMITMQWTIGAETHTATRSGRYQARSFDRLAAAEDIWETTKAELQIPSTANPVVLFFSLEPRSLTMATG